MTRPLNHKSSEMSYFYFVVILVVYLGHGMFRPVAVSFSLQIRFWERSQGPPN